jgi:DnaK suppressor protein
MAAKKKTAKSPASKKKAVAEKKSAPANAKTAAVKKTAAKKTAAKKAAPKKAAAKKATAKKKAPATKTAAKKSEAPNQNPATKSKKSSAAGEKAAVSPSTKKVANTKVSTSAQSAANQAAQPDVLLGPIHGVQPYKLSPDEEYMSDRQLSHFREILLNWKRELMEEVDRTIHHLQDEPSNFPDPNDRATQESEFGLELRTRDRERKLLRKIDSALARVEDGSYGYCEETGEEIGLRRLEARPIATLCLEAQERHEMTERHFGERGTDERYR